jgi:hypothetical protein
MATVDSPTSRTPAEYGRLVHQSVWDDDLLGPQTFVPPSRSI